MNVRRILFILTAVICSFYFFNKHQSNARKIDGEDPYVNVYCWYGMIPRSVIEEFQRETGISVRLDVYDSNEILEAKLLATNSGYDVVFPSAVPYAMRQIQAGVYQKIDKSALPNLTNLNATILSKIKPIDEHMTFIIPYFWGTVGIALDLDRVSALIPNPQQYGFGLFFNLEHIKKLAPCGVSFLEEAVDVFPNILAYLGKNPNSESLEDLDISFAYLLKLRPHIKRFTSARFINDLVMGDICAALAWSGDAHRAKEIGKNVGKNIVYYIPKEGTVMWIECIGIPAGAPHPKNAHKFINFILRKDMSAQIINYSAIPTVVNASYPLVVPSIREDENIFPSKEVLKRLRLDNPVMSEHSTEFDRKRTRAWAHVRLNGEK